MSSSGVREIASMRGDKAALSQVRPKKRVIYAPHWLSNPAIKMATIDQLGETMRRVAEKYQDDVQWAFRPHPMLKPRLMEAPEWGPQRTASFFSFWEQSGFSQIHEEDYLPLFRTSDAIIHDSGSFLAEYLYLKNPAMYLVTEETGEKYFNLFGRRAIKACDVGRSAADIEGFLDRLLSGETCNHATQQFFDEDISLYFQHLPSSKICDELRFQLS
ncbi:hypothetical protein OAV33_00415 [bacterium]|nr:hypothetical protein [bacterium]